MGCTASHPHITNYHHTIEQEFEQNHSNSNPSPSNSTDCVKRALSLPTHLVHHPPLRKGDTNHLVSLTSTTYGSLIIQNSQNYDSNEQNLSVINTWELMEGLEEEDNDDFEFVHAPSLESSYLIVEKEKQPDISDINKISKPLWKHLSEEKLLAKMDPNVGLSYQKALSSKQLGTKNNDQNKIQQKSCLLTGGEVDLAGTEDKIVLYHTSLRGIRRTYEDCCAVRMIIRGFRVHVDERDISMDSGYRKELQAALKGKGFSLPQVFIRGKHIGGVEQIKLLNEYGELAKALEGFPIMDSDYICESCGDLRFMPCLNCNGSRKIYGKGENGLKRCVECNENGLIRCRNCCA